MKTKIGKVVFIYFPTLRKHKKHEENDESFSNIFPTKFVLLFGN